MNKTAIKNFAVWARNKLITDIKYRAGLIGITEKGIAKALPQSTGTTEFYDIGSAEPYAINGEQVKQRKRLVDVINQKVSDSDYKTAYNYIIEEVAYTWFNRLIAVRFMEVNDYLPSHVRVLSSESGKLEPDLVTNPFDAELDFNSSEEMEIIQLKQDNKLDELFRMLFIKQCNALNDILPALFEKMNDYMELLLNISVVDQEGVVYHLIHDITEEDFDIERGGQVEIIGWLYQYYNTELNDQVYDGNMSKSRIPKELLPAATTIYTPDWAIRYMVENSLGYLWLQGHPDESLKKEWKYYLDEGEQSENVQHRLDSIKDDYAQINVEELKVVDPCMGSGHILVYAFDVLLAIYESIGYSQRDAARKIIENNLYGFDIDDRAFQLSYFAVMMKARQYNRRILSSETKTHIYAISESNGINRNHLKYLGADLTLAEKEKALRQIVGVLDQFRDAKEYGSILAVNEYDWDLLFRFIAISNESAQISMDSVGLDITKENLRHIIELASAMACKKDVVVTNPPYLGNSRFSPKLDTHIKENFADVKTDLSMVMYRHAVDYMAKKNGMIAFITTSSWMFLSSFEKLRNYIQKRASITSVVDFGTELFEGKVGHNPIVAWVTRNSIITDYALTAIRLVDYCYARRDEKRTEFFNPENKYISIQRDYSKIPGAPIAYWVSNSMMKAFDNPTIGDIAKPRQGMATADNNRFLRLWCEVDINRTLFDSVDADEAQKSYKKWFPYNKGGAYRKWYGNNDYLVNWENDGQELKAFKKSVIRNETEYFKECISWSKISSGSIAFRYKPQGHLFDVAGTSIFADSHILQYIHGFCNSIVALKIARMLSPTLNYEVGHISSFPIIYDQSLAGEINRIVEENIQLSKTDWDSFEMSWDFKRHPLTKYNTQNIEHAYELWEKEACERFEQLKKNEERLNEMFIHIYGMEQELTAQVEDKAITVRKADKKREIKSLLSYALGCMFGRYSLDTDGLAYAGGEWERNNYISFTPDEDNVIPITDEEYLEDDIIARLCAWLKAVYGEETLEENLDYISKNLKDSSEPSRNVIRDYYLNEFFGDHCGLCTVGVGGKRPIYWLFDSGKQNGFKALIYLHRYTPDTIGNLRIDYLHRMQRVYESEINRMQDTIDHSTNSREVGTASKRQEKLRKQLKECREYDEKIGHLALARIELDLDDGVKANYRKLQTVDGKFYEVLADSKNIMAKEK